MEISPASKKANLLLILNYINPFCVRLSVLFSVKTNAKQKRKHFRSGSFLLAVGCKLACKARAVRPSLVRCGQTACKLFSFSNYRTQYLLHKQIQNKISYFEDTILIENLKKTKYNKTGCPVKRVRITFKLL